MTTTTTRSDHLIRAALRGNGAFSALGGLVAMLFGAALGETTDLPPVAVRVVGLGLLPYAALLWRWSGREPVRPAEGWAAVVADAAWVVATAVLLVVAPDVVNAAGKALLIGIAVVVAGFAEAQFVGLRRLRA